MRRKTALFLLLSSWILIVIAGMTWKLMLAGFYNRKIQFPAATESYQRIFQPEAPRTNSPPSPSKVSVTNELLRYCNLPLDHEISGEEGLLTEQSDLVGAIIIFRHGDRGPLIPAASGKKINCSSYVTKQFKELEQTVLKAKYLDPKIQKYTVIPKSDQCKPGQLTKQGSSQLIELGGYLRRRYGNYLNFSHPSTVDYIQAYSTPYSRTIQSLRSLLYGLVGFNASLNVNILSEAEVSFCFNNCHCGAASRFEQMHKKELAWRTKEIRSTKLSAELKTALKEAWKTSKDALASSIKDVLLTYACHNTTPPCWNQGRRCLTVEMVDSLNDCLRFEANASADSLYLKKASLLRAYGVLQYIDRQIHQWVTQYKATFAAKKNLESPRFLFFSGHDLTLMYILSALSLYDGYLPSYASRLVVEIYSNQFKYYARLLWNGSERISPGNTRFLSKLLRTEMQKFFQTEDFRQACEF